MGLVDLGRRDGRWTASACGRGPRAAAAGRPPTGSGRTALRKQEAVEQGGQLLAALDCCGHSLLAATQSFSGTFTSAAVAVVVDALVEEAQQGVEDRRAGLEDLVEEGAVGLGQLAGGDAAVAVLLQAGDADRAEQLLRGR